MAKPRHADVEVGSGATATAAPFGELAALDRLVHEPARLAILTALSACASADFLYLQSLTGLTKGNLSSHLAKLEEAALIAVEKQFIGKTPLTRVRISSAGRAAVEEHWRRLEDIRGAALRWQPAS
jgi:DNA-binding transcriptional ArsR family regulator